MALAQVASAHALPIFPSAYPDALSGVIRGVAVKVAYFSLVATAFVFFSILLTGVHP